MPTLSTCLVSRIGHAPVFALVLTLAVGCAESTSPVNEVDNSAPRVPVSGKVTLNGKPLVKAVVTFLPQSGGSGVGETDAEGRYSLQSFGEDGVPEGEYKVAISYLLAPSGAPQGLGPRSSMIQSADMMAAKEQLPQEYSDLGHSKLTASVGPKGGTFDYDIKAELPEPPAAEEGAKKADAEPKVEAETPKGAEPKVEAVKKETNEAKDAVEKKD